MKLIILLLLSCTTPFISSQSFVSNNGHPQGNPFRRIQQGGGGGGVNRLTGNQATRLGLLATDLGIDPVPGGHNFNNFGAGPNSAGGRFNVHNSPRGCFCLPINQVCNPFDVIPRGSTRISVLDTRIINTNPQNPCPATQIECCFGNPGPVGPSIPPPIVNSQCGTRAKHYSRGSSADATAELGEYPWMVAVTDGPVNFVAGGALISARAVLTTAHSVARRSQYRVRVGDYDLSGTHDNPHQEISVANIIVHPNFNPKTLVNDIAILQLAQPVRLTQNVNTICLPEPRQIFTGSRCYLSGWGKNSQGVHSGTLREVDLPVLDPNTCQNLLRRTRLASGFNFDSNSFVCAGGEFGKDACTGDGGSPLVCEEHNGSWTVIGLVAWGIGCGTQNVPGVYANVAAYSNFIKQHL